MSFDLTREPNPNLGLPPGAVPGLSIIKALARELRYQSLDQLVGHTVNLTSIETAADEVRCFICTHGIELDEAHDNRSAGTFLKYGLLDYKFAVSNPQMTAERKSVRFLKEMDILPDKKDVSDAIFPDAGIAFLEEMLDDARKGKLILKIFLDSQGDYRGAKGAPVEKWANTDPNKYFPCKFIVRDACLTNCNLIWLNKHFYL